MLTLEQYVDIHVLEVCHEEGCYDLPMQQEDEPDPQRTPLELHATESSLSFLPMWNPAAHTH